MSQTKRLPKQVNLRAIMHNVAEHEGLIVFTPRDHVWGYGSSITFERKEQCWYLAVDSTSPDRMVMMSHVLKAWEIIKTHYGGNFVFKEPT